MKSFLKKMLPGFLFIYINEFYRINRLNIIKFFGNSYWLCNIYYTFFSKSFRREFFGVINGKGNYYQSMNKIGRSSPLLRRNIHRLEKGLIMKPRRSIFAESFILDTVRCYGKSINTKEFEVAELKWAKDVLELYFSVVDKTEVVKKAEDIYRRVSVNFNDDGSNVSSIPYEKKNSIKFSVEFKELTNLFRARRSTRWYLDKEVESGLVIKAVNSATYAPSACNRQPYRFVFIKNKNMVKEVASSVEGTAGFLDNIPSIMVVIGDLSCYEFERDRHLIYIDSSLAVMQLILALETLDLSSCVINFPDVGKSEDKIKKIIPIDNYERVIMLIAIGYPDISGGIPFSQKKSAKSIISVVDL